jgi:hypothetical protein
VLLVVSVYSPGVLSMTVYEAFAAHHRQVYGCFCSDPMRHRVESFEMFKHGWNAATTATIEDCAKVAENHVHDARCAEGGPVKVTCQFLIAKSIRTRPATGSQDEPRHNSQEAQ